MKYIYVLKTQTPSPYSETEVKSYWDSFGAAIKEADNLKNKFIARSKENLKLFGLDDSNRTWRFEEEKIDDEYYCLTALKYYENKESTERMVYCIHFIVKRFEMNYSYE